MNAATRLHPEEDNRQATNKDDKLILANADGLGYLNRLLVELLLAGTQGYDSVDATRQDSSCFFWCDRLTTPISFLKRRQFKISGYLRKLTLPDGQNTHRKCYYLTDRKAALQVINYLNDINQANHKPRVFDADHTAAILKRFKEA
ncbi:hypothetical protein [Endozoicomonas sp. ONNA2]|uniref:hypothetical protein n=1 Tax=Endozoicomonas sp. ONNA2 TaxID=2828741 RepID=UPI0021487077|nr:hypothetical protein [Endozoicomonas sp. ONNA2]